MNDQNTHGKPRLDGTQTTAFTPHATGGTMIPKKLFELVKAMMSWTFKDNGPFMLWSIVVLLIIASTLGWIAHCSPGSGYAFLGCAGLGGGAIATHKLLRKKPT